MNRVLIIFTVSILFFSCNKNEEDTPDNYNLVYPAHFPAPEYQFENNPFTREGFLLGRKLFYDPLLSVNNTVSCVTCHDPTHAFADHNIPLSFGVFGRMGRRNSPPVFNMIWNTSFMWDGGVNHIELSGFPAIEDENEMDTNLQDIFEKLNNHDEYPQLFEEAFDGMGINDQTFFWAITQFMGAIISSTSKYDKYLNGKASFSSEELAGLQLFRTHCESCHQEPLFTDYSFRNNGLDSDFTRDKGRYEITLNPDDMGKFKVPTLRNITFTYPYMHDGRFINLDQVLNHYSSGIVASATLDEQLQNGIPLTQEEKNQIKAFLETLTDYDLINNLEFYPQ